MFNRLTTQFFSVVCYIRSFLVQQYYVAVNTGSSHFEFSFLTGTIDMDLITTGISASERIRREQVLSATRNVIMEKMQLGGAAVRTLEVTNHRFSLTNFLVYHTYNI